MNTGCFFKLSEKTSMLYEGIVNYDYTVIRAYSGSQTSIPKYPISLSITKDALLFNVHCYGDSRVDDWEQFQSGANYHSDTGVSKESQDREQPTQYHVDNTIISIPYIKGGNHEEITKIIKSLYRAPFPVHGDCNQVMKDLYSILKKNGIRLSTDEDNKMPSFVSYSSLSVFHISDKGKEDKTCQEKQDDDSVLYTKVLRMLFLDFLFDLQHTDVFKTSPWYDRMIFYLNQNYYFTALKNKAEYYYQREIINNEDFDKLTNKQHIHFYCGNCFDSSEMQLQLKKLKSIGDNLVKAEKKWITSICDPQSDKYFYVFNNWVFKNWKGKRNDLSWFSTPEQEIKNIYYQKTPNIRIYLREKFICLWVKIKNLRKEIFQISQDRLCYNCPKKTKKYIITNSINLYNAILKSEKRIVKYVSNSDRTEEIRRQAAVSATWSLNRYNYSFIFGNKLGGVLFTFLFVFLLLVCLGSCMSIECPSFLSWANDFLTYPPLHKNILCLICVFKGLVAIAILLMICLNIMFLSIEYKKTFWSVLIISLIISCFINITITVTLASVSLFLLMLKENLWKIFLWYKRQPFPYFFNLQIFQPKLIASILAVLITSHLTDNRLTLIPEINGQTALYTGAIVTILTVCLLYDDIKRKLPYLGRVKTIIRSLSTFLLGFLYSVLIGIVSISTITYPNMMKSHDCVINNILNYPKLWEWICDFQIHPFHPLWNYLVFISFMALFFGVFVNMLSSRK